MLVERAAPDAERLADFGRAAPTGGQRLNGGDLFGGQARPATFAATRPRRSKPGHRSFNDQAPLKLSQSREHMEHQTPGLLTLSVAPTSRRHGIPYGSIPRVILAWICSEAVKTKEPVLSLGRSQSDFLESLKLHNNGRDIARFREQALRLFKSVISVEYTDDRHGDESHRLLISKSSHVFWHPKASEQAGLWESSLELSDDFFKEIMIAPVPIDMRVFHALTKSPLAMDIYTWLTYRMFILRRSGRTSAFVHWAGLKSQFGAGYPDTDQGFRDFKKRFRLRLKEVLLFYPAAQGHIQETPVGLALTPCELHIPHTNGAKLSSLPKPKPKA